MIHVDGARFTFDGLVLEDVFGVAIEAHPSDSPSSMNGVRVLGSSSASDALVRVTSGYLPEPQVTVRDLEVSSSTLEANPYQSFVDVPVPGVGMVVFSGVTLDFARATFADDRMLRAGPVLQLFDAKPDGLVVHDVTFAGDALPIWLDDKMGLDHASIAGSYEGVLASGAVTVTNTAFTDVAWPLTGASASAIYEWCLFDGVANPPQFAAPNVGCFVGDPDWLRYDPALSSALWDLRPHVGSDAIDAGDPATTDPDGTRADVGAGGGPLALLDPDDDGDGMLDSWEVEWLGSTDGDGSDDPDADGVLTLAEYAVGTIPSVADTDGDGADDGVDAAPLDPGAS